MVANNDTSTNKATKPVHVPQAAEATFGSAALRGPLQSVTNGSVSEMVGHTGNVKELAQLASKPIAPWYHTKQAGGLTPVEMGLNFGLVGASCVAAQGTVGRCQVDTRLTLC